jgi:hypothetical protein
MADARERAEQAITDVLMRYNPGEVSRMAQIDAARIAAALLDGPVPLAYLPEVFQPLLDLHRNISDEPAGRCGECFETWPCPTVAALPASVRREATGGQ